MLTKGCVQSNLELELRLQQFIELTRSGETAKLIEATVHARKYLSAQQDTDYGLRAGGLLAYPSNTLTEPYKVRSSFLLLSNMRTQTKRYLDNVRRRPLGIPRPTLHQNPSRDLLAPATPSPPHRALSRSLGAENSVLPLRVR